MTEKNGVERSTATDVLRRLLDERGVEWTAPNSILRDTMTCWTAGRFYYEAFEVPEPDGTFLLTAAHQDDLTPEQAIAATLGSCNCSNNCTNGERTETCHDKGTFKSWGLFTCSNCSIVFPLNAVKDAPSIGRTLSIRYCPNCGRKVVDE